MDDENESKAPEPPEEAANEPPTEPPQDVPPKKTCEPCKYPVWPVVLGSVVPLLVVVFYFYVLWRVAFGQAIPADYPNAAALSHALFMALIWFGIFNLIYFAVAYLLDFLAVWGFARRKFGKTLLLTYVLRAWKLTGFLLSFYGFIYVVHLTSLGLGSSIIVWLGLIFSFVVAVFLGAAILELVYKVDVSKKMFVTLMVTDVVAFIATVFAVNALFSIAPK